ncbi:MAG: DpnII family type II restriction endonuclease [bacterium]|nr:DpnII family type II restriction endonuclease [bacterium]
MVPEEWVQAILDSNSGRKKGCCGENKLLHILENNGFKKVDNWKDFLETEKCVTRFSKIFDLKAVRQNLNIKIDTHKQDKRLDLIIKNCEKLFLLEAKHLNTAGGGQDKQLSELIELLTLSEKDKNIFYIAFLDGNYSNILLGDDHVRGKLKIQRQEIKKFLKKNPNNYWVNTDGLKELLGCNL